MATKCSSTVTMYKCLLTSQLLWKSFSTWFIVAESRPTWLPSTLQAWAGGEVCYIAPVCVNSCYSLIRSVSLHNPSGREDNVLLLTYKYCKLVMFPIVSGREDNWLLPPNNHSKLVMFPIVDGREDSVLLPTNKHSKLVMFSIVDGREDNWLLST